MLGGGIMGQNIKCILLVVCVLLILYLIYLIYCNYKKSQKLKHQNYIPMFYIK